MEKTNKNKEIKSIITVLLSIILVLTQFLHSYACTIFSGQQEGKVLVGNNEDWMYSISSNICIAAPAEDSFGRIYFSLSSYVQGGMNEKGLFYDGATCPESKIPVLEGKPQVDMNFGELILSRCANVKEAVEMVKQINIPGSFSDHIMLADESGSSVVVEWVENELRIIPKEGSYQIATNFWLSNPKLGGNPCSRYDKVEEMLKGSNAVTVDNFKQILKATAQNWGDGGTKYSNIYDLKNKEVYVYNKADFEKSSRIKLKEELAKLEKGQKRTLRLEELSLQSGGSKSEKQYDSSLLIFVLPAVVLLSAFSLFFIIIKVRQKGRM